MGLYRISYILPLLFVFYSLIRMKKAGEVLCVYIDIYMESETHVDIQWRSNFSSSLQLGHLFTD